MSGAFWPYLVGWLVAAFIVALLILEYLGRREAQRFDEVRSRELDAISRGRDRR